MPLSKRGTGEILVSTDPHPGPYSDRATLVVWLAGGLTCWVAVLALFDALL